jgi:hypothetical protein
MYTSVKQRFYMQLHKEPKTEHALYEQRGDTWWWWWGGGGGVAVGFQSSSLGLAKPLLNMSIGPPYAGHSPDEFYTIGRYCWCFLPCSVCGPKLVLKDQPAEYFAFVLYFGRPYHLPVMISKGTSKLDIVGRARCILPICCEPPNDIVKLVCQTECC